MSVVGIVTVAVVADAVDDARESCVSQWNGMRRKANRNSPETFAKTGRHSIGWLSVCLSDGRTTIVAS